MSTLKVNNTRNGDSGYCGGRSSSQISIYDYPEHLNPFYEDENHKRIRFWHIGKSKKNKYNNNNNNGTSSRRGSFSFGGIKDMWAFKSFRLRKKSSNLGINKTSESPPPLRRLQDDENHYGTYDPRMRHTIGINNTLNNNFLRNIPYRASLQDMRSGQNVEHNNNNNNGLGFERNNRYRSTIQTTTQRNRPLTNSGELSPMAPPRRYVYGGSVTPQPRLRSNDIEDDYSGISRGSSQMSIASKNPFEEDGNEDIVICKIPSSGTEQKGKRPIRKKRRAPPPPIPISKIINEESQATINENSPTNTAPNEENVEIKNLTVEIENFVKSANDRSEENAPIKKIENDKISEDKSDEHLIEENISTKDSETVEHLSSSQNNRSEKEIETIETVTTTKSRFIISERNTDNDDCRIEKQNFIENLEETKADDNVELRTKEIKSQNSVNDIVSVSSNNHCTSETENLTGQISSEGTSQIEIIKPESDFNQAIELKITESIEDLSERSQKSEVSNDVINETVYLPLNNYKEIKEINVDSKEICNESNEIQEQQEQPPVRRRSVREIIESINRSQKLLNVNQTSTSGVRNVEEFNNLNNSENDLNIKLNDQIKAPPRKKHDLKDKEFSKEQIESVISEINTIANREAVKFNYENDENIITNEILEKLSDKINNDNKECEIFKKCEIKKVNTNTNRETSPTSSNLDWNPLPKPKRTKKLAIELQDDQNSIKNE